MVTKIVLKNTITEYLNTHGLDLSAIHEALEAHEVKTQRVRNLQEDALPWFQKEIGLGEEERFAVIFLKQGKIVGKHIFNAGSISRTVIYPRELFHRAFECKATSMILAHNHPGGMANPSMPDRELTRKIENLGQSLECELIDHFIVTKTSAYFSFKESGSL